MSEEREGAYYFMRVKDAIVHRSVYKNASTFKLWSTSKLWYRRLGHPSYRVLPSLPLLDRLCFDS